MSWETLKREFLSNTRTLAPFSNRQRRALFNVFHTGRPSNLVVAMSSIFVMKKKKRGYFISNTFGHCGFEGFNSRGVAHCVIRKGCERRREEKVSQVYFCTFIWDSLHHVSFKGFFYIY